MYAISDYSLHFSSNYHELIVKDINGVTVDTFDLTQDQPFYHVKVVDGAYVIAQSACTDCEDRFAIDVEVNAGSAYFEANKLGGLNIIDLRDTGRSVKNIEFDLECGQVDIQRKSGAWALRFWPANEECYQPS
jgi:hypothetical protein